MSRSLHVRIKSAKDLVCPYCRSELTSTYRHLCGSCGTRMHLACWGELQGCTTLGCEPLPQAENTLSPLREVVDRAREEAHRATAEARRAPNDAEVEAWWFKVCLPLMGVLMYFLFYVCIVGRLPGLLPLAFGLVLGLGVAWGSGRLIEEPRA